MIKIYKLDETRKTFIGYDYIIVTGMHLDYVADSNDKKRQCNEYAIECVFLNADGSMDYGCMPAEKFDYLDEYDFFHFCDTIAEAKIFLNNDIKNSSSTTKNSWEGKQ